MYLVTVAALRRPGSSLSTSFYVYPAGPAARQNADKNEKAGAERAVYYVVDSDKSVSDAARDLEAAVRKGGFGVLHVYDLKQTLEDKGVALSAECRIFEVCNPQLAATVLGADMNLSMALPCRISVYEADGRTKIGTIKPTVLLGLLAQNVELASIARGVENALENMIDEAAAGRSHLTRGMHDR